MALPTKPATPVPTWATDANYTSGDDVGLSTKVEPTSGEKAEGHFRGKRPPARKINWLKHWICQWLGWTESALDDIEPRITASERYCYASIAGSAIASGSEFTLAIVDEAGGFTVSGNNIVIPETGVYEVAVLAWLTSDASGDPAVTGMDVKLAGSRFGIADGIRWNSSTSRSFPVTAPLRKFDATAGQELSLTSNGVSDVSVDGTISPQELYNYLLIHRIS